MANLGDYGNAFALTPFSPVPRKAPSRAASRERDASPGGGLLSRTQAGCPQHKAVIDDYVRIVGNVDGEMTEEEFIAAAAQFWGFSRRSARACFHAADVDECGRLDKDKFTLVYEAFVRLPEDGAPEESKERLELCIRAIYHLYVLSRPAQRSAEGTVLTLQEATDWIRDMCAGETHVEHVAQRLLPKLQNGASNADGVTIDEFVRMLTTKEFAEHLRSERLSIDDLVGCLRSTVGRDVKLYSRTVLDGRAETAYMRLGNNGSADGNLREGTESDYVPPDAVNADMELDPHMRAVGGWRGPLAPARETEEYGLAMQVIERAMQLARDEALSEDKLDNDWLMDGAAMRTLLGKGEAKQADAIRTLAAACKRQIQAHPVLVRVDAPAKIFGDVHGQLRDLLLLFGQFGTPFHCGGDIQTTRYVFNGDFVDRGEHQLSVVCLLFALKTVYPAHIFLVRGNHEFREINAQLGSDGFLRHCQRRFPVQWQDIFETVHDVFDWLPLAALVGGRILVLHGGLGDGSYGLKDIEKMKRPLKTTGDDPIAINMLWSDPSDSDSSMKKGVHANPERGDSKIHMFGPDVTMAFCKREGINLVVRSHQYVRQGYKVMHGGHLITLFSARNYFAEDDNDGAMLLVAPDVNGHLRVHPKRLAKLDVGAVFRSQLRRAGLCNYVRGLWDLGVERAEDLEHVQEDELQELGMRLVERRRLRGLQAQLMPVEVRRKASAGPLQRLRAGLTRLHRRCGAFVNSLCSGYQANLKY
eukprot:TRINITY_DN23355_c0_g1_i1.p1 TRINITY_DN23355_c0_g1~~TRINITY_DN23355_c0_g1_i1.p1  ORF type:complete len:756 (+),score=193.05 TRINITY_DN23355_c0_g1_i1:101-2368(+)